MEGWWWWWWVSSRNWRRHPPVTFYSLTLADYRQLMHNKYTPLRVHYHLINISPWRERLGRGWADVWWGSCVTDVFLRLRWNRLQPKLSRGRRGLDHFPFLSSCAHLQPRSSWSSIINFIKKKKNCIRFLKNGKKKKKLKVICYSRL